ncbi:hypothetical protein RQP46_001312 [Phenoliferia psychrophenolica]
MIKPYRALLETPFPIYGDISKKTYIALGMTLRTLDHGGPANVPEYLMRGALGNVLVSIMVRLLKMPRWLADEEPPRDRENWEN